MRGIDRYLRHDREAIARIVRHFLIDNLASRLNHRYPARQFRLPTRIPSRVFFLFPFYFAPSSAAWAKIDYSTRRTCGKP
jgi:hypothetical protein